MSKEERNRQDCCCGNCNFYVEFSGVCCNGESEYRANFTDFDFTCDCFEKKTE